MTTIAAQVGCVRRRGLCREPHELATRASCYIQLPLWFVKGSRVVMKMMCDDYAAALGNAAVLVVWFAN